MNDMKKSYADMDPLEELRAIREEINREFPTLEAYFAHLRKNFPAASPAAEPQRKSHRTSAKPKAKANTRPALRQRKSAAHA